MLSATDLAHRYPTPTSPEHVSPMPQRSLPLPKPEVRILQQQSPNTSTSQPYEKNEASFSYNAKAAVNGAPMLTPLQPGPIVIVPPASAEARRSDFVTYEEPSEGSRKRKRGSATRVGANLSQTRDQRAASDEAMRQLQENIQDIFEADDQSQPDALGPAVHVKLESSLQKVITVGRLGEIPVEHVQRLQRLCEAALSSAESSDLRIQPEWSTEDFADWVQRLEVMDLGLRSARTIVRMMTGGREEKQLYSEELLKSVLGVVKKGLDQCIIPIVEARSSGSSSAIFEAASSHKKVISQLLFNTIKVMALLARLLAKVEMAEMVTGIAFFAPPLLFVENAHSEKESVLGIHKFENLRRTAMDMIATIFSRYPEQRISLFDEILTSLQKLPVSRQHARQFKLGDGKSIQLVSALIMRLVQTSATHSDTVKKAVQTRISYLSDEEQEKKPDALEKQQSMLIERAEDSDQSDDSEDNAQPRSSAIIQSLSKEASFLMDNAARSAQYVVRHLVHRAMSSSKTGDQPHRQLLDIFVEDLIAVLSLPEWPASELLLTFFLTSCRNITENAKSLAPAKNMALELLGQMGSAISELVSNTRLAARSLENDDSQFSGYLQQMLDDYTDGSLEDSEIVIWGGPFHAVVEHLQPDSLDDLQTGNAPDYYLARWVKAFSSGDVKPSTKSEDTASKLRKMLSGADWYTADPLHNLNHSQIQVAYSLTLLSMDFCRQSNYILKILLDSVTSEQITVRTRSLKSVTQMLERDPSILDRARSVKVLITNCSIDASSMVRDSALTLIGKCIVLRPALENEFLSHMLRLTNDPAAGVRKRSMKLLKEIYLRNDDRKVKTVVGDSLLQRAKDLDTGVSDLARLTFEEIWLMPYWSFADLVDASAQNKVAFRFQVSLIVGTVQGGGNVSSVLVHLLKQVLSNSSKSTASNFKVCKSLVATAFDMTIDNTQGIERLEQRHILQTLTVFAKADARLFTPDQLQELQPYISNLSGKDDLDVFRSTVVIFRCVLPVLSNVQHGLLREVQKALLQSIAKLGRAELDEVAECLWTINGTLQNPELLIRLTVSVLKNLHNMKAVAFADSSKVDDLKRVKKYIQIAGYVGKHCDFESHSLTFQSSFTWWKGKSVAGLLVDSIHPFTGSSLPLSLRVEAFDSIGLICQSWPYQYTQEHISTVFQDVLRGSEPELQSIVLSSFREFCARIDRQAETKNEVLSSPDGPSVSKLGGSMTANDGDGASALIAQRFLKDTLAIALASQDTSALTATEVIASINRQGLVHPKESGPALVALETSTNPAIARVAFEEHRILHQQHESMFEREYMRAIQEAFRYQKDIVGDTLGYTKQPYVSKLAGMFDIIKTSKGKYQKKFLSNYCAKIDFELTRMDLSGSPPNVLQFSRFLTENLAFFDYGRHDELLHTIACTEKIVADTGSGIAHNISTEVFNLTVGSVSETPVKTTSHDQSSSEAPSTSAALIDPLRLVQLTTASIILSSLWEARTYLRRLYGLSGSQQRKDNKAKAAAKDLNKAPSRAQGVSPDRLVTAIAEKVKSLDHQDSMIQQCREFIELLSVDSEIKVRADDDEDLERPQTPSEGEDPDAPMSRLKRKSSVSIAGTPLKKKKKGRPSLGKRRRSGKSVDSDEDYD
ncbi:cohesin loading factor subunit SCC2, partial [Lecanoromycetidae sp. Uapishka_2]